MAGEDKIRLKDFPDKTMPSVDDIVYLGDSANEFNEVKTTVSNLIVAYSPALASIASLITTANQMLYTTAPNTYAVTTITAFGRNLVASSDQLTAQTQLGVRPGIEVQEYSPKLKSIADLNLLANQMIYTIADNEFATTSFTSFAKDFVALSGVTNAQTYLDVVPRTGTTMTGPLILNADPVNALGAATKQYVDNSIGGSGLYLRITNNLSDLSNFTTARSNLGVAIGTDVQAYSLALTSIAGLTTAANQMIYTSGPNTYAVTSITAFGRSLVATADFSAAQSLLNLVPGTTVQAFSSILNNFSQLFLNADALPYATGPNTFGTTSFPTFGRTLVGSSSASAAQTTLNLVPGTNVQAYSAALASIAGLTTSANQMIYTTSSNTYATTGITAFGRSLVNAADASAARTTLGIGATIVWTTVTTNTVMTVNTGYITNSNVQVLLTLPTTAAAGDIFEVAGRGSGGWQIRQNAGQIIRLGNDVTATGAAGTLSSLFCQYAAVKILCINANTEFSVISSVGNLNLA